MSDIVLKIASESDLRLIHDFLSEHFHNVEPIEVSHRTKHEKVQPNDEYLLSCIRSNTCLMAYCGNALAGVLIAGTIFANEHERNLEAAKVVRGRNEKHGDVLRFLSYIDEKANYCNRLGVPAALHIHIIAVHREFKERGIARTLFECCVENGRKANYQAVTVDCTSHYTARIAEQRAFSLMSTVTYDEYHAFIGETLFEPSFPHMQIKSYALLLRNSTDDFDEHHTIL